MSDFPSIIWIWKLEIMIKLNSASWHGLFHYIIIFPLTTKHWTWQIHCFLVSNLYKHLGTIHFPFTYPKISHDLSHSSHALENPRGITYLTQGYKVETIVTEPSSPNQWPSEVCLPSQPSTLILIFLISI